MEDEDFVSVLGGSVSSEPWGRRSRYRKFAQRDLGRLTIKAISQYKEFLASATGDEDEDELSRIFLRWFLLVFAPSQASLKDASDKFREMRTL
eukprot:7485385-Karenia_brevis.AAC.1